MRERLRTRRAARGRRFDKRPRKPRGGAPHPRRRSVSATVGPWGPVLDQGRENHCGGFAAAGMVLARADIGATATEGNALGVYAYRWAIERAPSLYVKYPGADSTVMFALEHGLATGCGSARDLDELAVAVVDHGPVSVALRWYRSMSSPRGGEMTVTPDSTDSYHRAILIGYDPARRWRNGTTGPGFLLLNSWGAGWSRNGRAWVPARGLGQSLAFPGEDTIAARNSYCTGWIEPMPGLARNIVANPGQTRLTPTI